MSNPEREKAKADAKRAQIRALIAEGVKLSKIAKLTGVSYPHVKQIAKQEAQP